MKRFQLTVARAFAFALTLLAAAAAAAVLGGCDSGAAAGGDDDGGGGSDARVGSDGGATPDAAVAYTEPGCPDPLAALSDLQAAYQNTTAGVRTAVLGIADRRYPIGREFLVGQTDSELARWFQSTATFGGVLDGFETAVHEGQHMWDIRMIDATGWPYRVRDDLVIKTRRLTNFARSEILTLHADAANDQYASVYLMGQSGTQGFNNLLDEYNAYTHSLAARFCTRDAIPAGTRISARDGILTMMYYVELYLKAARTNHAADYAAILADPEHRRLVLTIWDRAEFWLAKAGTVPSLGLRDAAIRTRVYEAANKMEIDLLRQ